ncbi:MAG: phosphoesterase, partial [Lachnospiraceae bacterium]|nr:phosphoesterase [Lachnospiraceae bacterium]
ANDFGITAIPGMELTTAEEVHVVCLFPTLEDALAFDAYVEPRILPIPNKPDKWGNQIIIDENDEPCGTFDTLLISATDISFDAVYDLLEKFHGVMIPAHIEKSTFSLIANLGFVPPDSKFHCFELKNMGRLHEVVNANPILKNCNVITDSDAHQIDLINEPINTILVEENSVRGVLDALVRPVKS